MEKDTMNGEEEKQFSAGQMSIQSETESKSTAGATHSKSEGCNKLQNERSSSPSSSANNGDIANGRKGNKAKSCKGALYYDSRFKAKSRNPLCVGITRSLPDVPQYIVGQSEIEASEEGRSLIDFRYACMGYSLYADRKEKAIDGEQTPTELPMCFGLEVLVDRRVKSADSASAPTSHIYNREDSNGLPPRRSPKPTNSTGDDFYSRFTRNANLVANGVVKHLYKVGNVVKQSVEYTLDEFRRRPK